jgi:hypothetical protein
MYVIETLNNIQAYICPSRICKAASIYVRDGAQLYALGQINEW